MHNGCILVGGVGTGKSRTALYYYMTRVCSEGGKAGPPLFIITTARKRDTKDWEKEAEPFGFPKGTVINVDSWNNIQKYTGVEGGFFIFDEQRLVGTGKWAKAFRKIAKNNQWILLSATPGDCWNDYANVFIANGFYRNLTDFRNQHIVYSQYTKFPKIDHYVGQGQLVRQRKEIVVQMPFAKSTVPHDEIIYIPYDKELTKLVCSTRWDPYKDAPIQDAGALCYVLRRAVNSDERRIEAVKGIMELHPKAIVFYNFDYELEMLRKMAENEGILCAEVRGVAPSGQIFITLPDEGLGIRSRHLERYRPGELGAVHQDEVQAIDSGADAVGKREHHSVVGPGGERHHLLALDIHFLDLEEVLSGDRDVASERV